MCESAASAGLVGLAPLGVSWVPQKKKEKERNKKLEPVQVVSEARSV